MHPRCTLDAPWMHSRSLFAVCCRWVLGAFLFLSSHVGILTSHDARCAMTPVGGGGRAGGEPGVTPLSRPSSCVVKVAPRSIVKVAPRPEGRPDVTPTLTTQQLRRESLKVKILLFRPSRHSSCVVKVCPASSSKSSETFAGVAFLKFTAAKFAALVCFG